MEVGDLVRRCPVVYHMAELGTWPSIQTHGLLSTTALLDLFDITGPRREELESRWRPRSASIEHRSYGRAVIRDQRPMPENELRPLLTGMEPEEWYRLLNGKVFFWAELYGLRKLLGAVMYRGRSHDVLTVDTQGLVDRHLERMWLTDQNTGSALSGKTRGPDTFKRVRDFRSPWVTEMAIDYSVPRVADFTLRVEEWQGDNRVRDVWSRVRQG